MDLRVLRVNWTQGVNKKFVVVKIRTKVVEEDQCNGVFIIFYGVNLMLGSNLVHVHEVEGFPKSIGLIGFTLDGQKLQRGQKNQEGQRAPSAPREP